MTLYLSGTNSGSSYYDIKRLKKCLSALGCTLIIPEELMMNIFKWSEKLQMRLSILDNCDAILVLSNWKESYIARVELTAAMVDRIPLCFNFHDIKQLITTLDG